MEPTVFHKLNILDQKILLYSVFLFLPFLLFRVVAFFLKKKKDTVLQYRALFQVFIYDHL